MKECKPCERQEAAKEAAKIDKYKGYAKLWAEAKKYTGWVAVVRLPTGAISHRTADNLRGAEPIELLQFDSGISL